MTKRSRTRPTSILPSGSPRPEKIQRTDRVIRGATIHDPIILDDSDGENEAQYAFAPQDLDFSDLFVGQENQDLALRPATRTPGSSSDDIEVINTSPTELFYFDSLRAGHKTPAFRSLPVQTKQESSGKAKQSNLLQLSPGWSSNKANHWVNIYLEGPEFGDTTFDRFSHLHMRDLSALDLEAIHLRDLRAELARLLDKYDPLSLQLEIQHARAVPNHAIFAGRSCSRPHAGWDDISIDDRHTLAKALPNGDAWIRVRIAEYLRIVIPSKDFTISITPSAAATVSHVRELVASVSETSPGAVSLLADDIQLVDEMGLLNMWGLDSRSTVTATIETRECANCLDDAAPSDFPFEPTTDTCEHNLDICKQCITTWINTSLDNGNWKNISCLSVDCGGTLQYADVKRNCLPMDMERYERFATRDALSEIPGFKWCLNQECDHGQIHDDAGGIEPILTCEACRFKCCTACNRAWHQDETCEQYTQRLAAQPGQVDASDAWVANNSRKCPGCQSPIQKTEGCDHMTCTRCRRQFCWLCQADYVDIRRDGNAAHGPNCQYHAGNIIDPHAPPRHFPPVPLPAPRRVGRPARAPPVRAAPHDPNAASAPRRTLNGLMNAIPAFGGIGNIFGGPAAANVAPPQAPDQPAIPQARPPPRIVRNYAAFEGMGGAEYNHWVEAQGHQDARQMAHQQVLIARDMAHQQAVLAQHAAIRERFQGLEHQVQRAPAVQPVQPIQAVQAAQAMQPMFRPDLQGNANVGLFGYGDNNVMQANNNVPAGLGPQWVDQLNELNFIFGQPAQNWPPNHRP